VAGPIPIIDHVPAALARLPAQLVGKQNYSAPLTIFGARMNALEQVFNDIYASRTIQGAVTAGGIALDRLGGIVGEPRNGQADQTYAVYIAVRILLNRSSGTGDDVLRPFKILLASGTFFELREEFPASFTLYISGPLPPGLSVRDGVNIVGAAKAAGVRAILQTDDNPLSRMLVLTDARLPSQGTAVAGVPFLDGADGSGNPLGNAGAGLLSGAALVE
jgi:hypothetical protein